MASITHLTSVTTPKFKYKIMKINYLILLFFFLSFPNPGYSQTAQNYFNSGLEKFKKSDYNGAIAEYSKAIWIEPKNSDAYFGRGGAKYLLKDLKGAIADYTTCLEIDQKKTNVHFGRGYAKYQLNDFKGAIDDFTEEIKINPKLANAYFYRGIAQLTLGQKDMGCLDFSKAGDLGHAKAYEAIKKFCQ